MINRNFPSLLALAALASSASAQSAYSGFGPGGSFQQASYVVHNNLKFQFVPYDSGPLTSIDIVVCDWANYPLEPGFGSTTSGPLPFTVSLFDDPDGGAPSGPLLGSWAGMTNGQQFGSVNNQVTTSVNVPASGVRVQSGKPYYIQVTSDYLLGFLVGSDDVVLQINTGQPTTVPGFSPAFELNVNGFRGPVGNASPVPEPSAFAALCLGAVALVRRRRRA